ncbi:MAG TPA: hypothetical protein VN372_07275 [Methanospirillum sp.]|nr:hypothetical protein [Methanospirillum sp.]
MNSASGTEPVHPAVLFILFLFMVLGVAITARYAGIEFPWFAGVNAFFIAAVVMILSALWFGGWGVLAMYTGLVLSGYFLEGYQIGFILPFILADLWQAAIPLVAFRELSADPGLRSRRDIAIFLLFGVIGGPLAGAVWGVHWLASGGYIPAGMYHQAIGTWFFSNAIPILLFATPILWLGTEYVRRSELYIAGWFR